MNTTQFNELLVENNVKLIFMDKKHHELWDLVVDKIENLQPNNFLDIDYVKELYCSKYNHSMLNDCFACHYADTLSMFFDDIKMCKYCPFEAMHTTENCQEDCLNGMFDELKSLLLHINTLPKNTFNWHKQRAISLAKEIRDAKICKNVICQSAEIKE